MEDSLKARLIGAAVLVALAVLLIPELLSGRKEAEPVAEAAAGPRGTRTFTIELGEGAGPVGRSSSAASAPLPVTPADDAAPASGATMAEVAPTNGEPPVEPAEPQAAGTGRPSRPAPTEAAGSPPAAAATQSGPAASAAPRAAPSQPAVSDARTTGGWAVQVGAFGSADTARKLAADLAAAGYRAFVSPVKRGSKTLYRVRVGPEGDRAAAEQLAPRLKARGLPATVVQND